MDKVVIIDRIWVAESCNSQGDEVRLGLGFTSMFYEQYTSNKCPYPAYVSTFGRLPNEYALLSSKYRIA